MMNPARDGRLEDLVLMAQELYAMQKSTPKTPEEVAKEREFIEAVEGITLREPKTKVAPTRGVKKKTAESPSPTPPTTTPTEKKEDNRCGSG
jgi:hypothetical protein